MESSIASESRGWYDESIQMQETALYSTVRISVDHLQVL